MPIDNPLSMEDLSNLPLDSSINPNITIGDSFNERQRTFLLTYYNSTDEELAAFDEQFLERGVPFSKEMEHLIDSEKTKLRKPLENPILPKGITEDPKWQEYISKNVSDPEFVPTTDPDEIADIIDMSDEWFDQYLYEVVVSKKYLESDIVDLYEKQDAQLLPPWDPMGALAR